MHGLNLKPHHRDTDKCKSSNARFDDPAPPTDVQDFERSEPISRLPRECEDGRGGPICRFSGEHAKPAINAQLLNSGSPGLS